jgi:ABC-type multidrug transport system fused ATPase/permease subunit
VRQFQHYSTSTQASLSLLNVLQQIIMHSTLLGGLILAARSVNNGRYSVGEFVSVNTYMVNLFTPLNFLGTVYNVSNSSKFMCIYFILAYSDIWCHSVLNLMHCSASLLCTVHSWNTGAIYRA